MRRTPAVVAPLLILLAILATALPAAAPSPIAIGIADPTGDPIAVLDAHVARVGTTPHLFSVWSNWGSRGGQQDCVPGFGDCAFPTETVKTLQSRGVTPVLWWLPTNPDNWQAGKYERYKRILGGVHDSYIRAWARAARDAGRETGKPVVVRFAQEATGHWFPWAIGQFDNTRTNYLAAWRYVWRIFRNQGALPHVRFLWSNVWPKEWAYPGDRYVDYVGITVLNFGAQRKWKPAAGLLRNRVTASQEFTQKPIFVAEMATHWKPRSKARWLKDAYWLSYRRYPKIKGIIYLDTDQPHQEMGHPDWRLVKPNDGSALRAYKGIAANSRFKGRIR